MLVKRRKAFRQAATRGEFVCFCEFTALSVPTRFQENKEEPVLCSLRFWNWHETTAPSGCRIFARLSFMIPRQDR
jgi:hypothetical protein